MQLFLTRSASQRLYPGRSLPLIRISLLALAYFATGWLGLQMPYSGTHITLVWLPTGISVAALLVWGRVVWPGVLLGAFVVNLSIGSSWPLALGIAAGNTLGPLLCVRWLTHVGFHPAFDRQKDVASFFVAAMLGMALSATLGVANLHLAGLVPWESLGPAWLSWWMGDAVGVLLVGPLLVTLNRNNLAQLIQDRKALLLWLAVALPVVWLAFVQDYGELGRSLPLAFLTLPLFAWAALRFGMTGASLAGLAFSVAAAWGTTSGHGTFALSNPHLSLGLLWMYMATTVVTGLLISALQTQRKLAEDEVTNLAFYDPLTRLPNRRLLMDRLHHAMAASARSGRCGALLFMDLDNFKTLNDTLGHDKGDLLLQQVGQRLVSCIRQGDTVARLGGDEFVVVLEDLSDNPEDAASQTETVGEKILAALNQPYELAEHKIRSTASIGATLFTGRKNAIDELLQQADMAMYQSKTAGRNTLRFFDKKMQAVINERAALEADLREAVKLNQFVLHYQPQVFGEGRLTGAEALVRWQHPSRGLVSPAQFIPLAEETGLILPLGHWVLETACAQLALWADQPRTALLTLAVNISAKQLHQADFVGQVVSLLAKTGAPPNRLKLELTESLLVSHLEISIAKMAALKAYGVGFSMDDFGTGYSSLTSLKQLPVSQLKIDQSFVRDILIDPNDAAIAKMIIALAESLGLTVIAEGVESAEQRDVLDRLGCMAYQGYFFGRPQPIDEFEAYVERIQQG